mmetsp:Transcript_13169/g.14593  ORF Transcript_13169/g.14593 Transcript_13169/m.14593 type:complete len:246 (-) Transcript_13169:66-803(-)
MSKNIIVIIDPVTGQELEIEEYVYNLVVSLEKKKIDAYADGRSRVHKREVTKLRNQLDVNKGHTDVIDEERTQLIIELRKRQQTVDKQKAQIRKLRNTLVRLKTEYDDKLENLLTHNNNQNISTQEPKTTSPDPTPDPPTPTPSKKRKLDTVVATAVEPRDTPSKRQKTTPTKEKEPQAGNSPLYVPGENKEYKAQKAFGTVVGFAIKPSNTVIDLPSLENPCVVRNKPNVTTRSKTRQKKKGKN